MNAEDRGYYLQVTKFADSTYEEVLAKHTGLLQKPANLPEETEPINIRSKSQTSSVLPTTFGNKKIISSDDKIH